jgi:predicted transcriptional regulator
MTAEALKDVMRRAESWPQEAQDELAEIAREIENALQGGLYHASPAELAGIDRGLKAAQEGRFATAAQVEAVFAKHRP